MKFQVFFLIIINIVNTFEMELNLYTKENSENPYKLIPDESGENFIQHSDHFASIDFTLPVKLLIHGWENDGTEDWVVAMRRTYLEVEDANYNVIVVGWGSIAKNINYFGVVGRLHSVANEISQYIEIMEHAMSFNVKNLHIVGHSLGAHIAGFVGSHFHGTIGRITALDPAGPWFLDGVPNEYRIHRENAQFVDVIHTCAGTVGLRMPCGHVDYYVNEGTCAQPGCHIPLKHLMCGHGRACELMTDSIKNRTAFRVNYQYCNKNGKVGQCTPKVFMHMGEAARKRINGLFQVYTNGESPFHRIDHEY